jgi:SAM-dependent methyltransferase
MKFETQFTRDFISRSLPSGARRVLEIGCGSGELAASLLRDGVCLIAIDSDADSIAAAQTLGVDARIAAWPDFEDGLFDAVLFTRSLHHIHPLEEAVHRAGNSLVIGGRLIVDDFAYESADENSLDWFGQVIERLDCAGVLITGDDFLGRVRSKAATLEAWRENHESHLHTAAAMLAEIRRVFGKVRCEEAPYYFRYLARAIVSTADRNRILQDLAEQEAELIARGTILSLGCRFVAERSK